jgi:hypothetical protein
MNRQHMGVSAAGTQLDLETLFFDEADDCQKILSIRHLAGRQIQSGDRPGTMPRAEALENRRCTCLSSLKTQGPVSGISWTPNTSKIADPLEKLWLIM